MSAKPKNIYVCSECGYESPKWYGKCPDCGAWNSFVEEIKQVASATKGVFVPTSALKTEKISEI
ncbi:MAG: DNA repair protein RadA, partial [Oscillospiraceae bacterium]|nr:DNA repair protein RadA [Oscillospiraceae bacterium]